jgi:hypothetical protein
MTRRTRYEETEGEEYKNEEALESVKEKKVLDYGSFEILSILFNLGVTCLKITT